MKRHRKTQKDDEHEVQMSPQNLDQFCPLLLSEELVLEHGLCVKKRNSKRV